MRHGTGLDVIYVQYPVDGSWEDENLVFDATKDEWEWPSDDAFSSVKTEQSEQVDEVKKVVDPVQTEDESLNAPMHTLGTTIQVSALKHR